MTTKQPSITVRRRWFAKHAKYNVGDNLRDAHPEAIRYVVERAVNTFEVEVGDELTQETCERLISVGIDVTILADK